MISVDVLREIYAPQLHVGKELDDLKSYIAKFSKWFCQLVLRNI